MMRPDREECLKRLSDTHNVGMTQAKEEIIDLFKAVLIEKAPSCSDDMLQSLSNTMFNLYILCALQALENYREEKDLLIQENELLITVDKKVDELLDLLTGVDHYNKCSPGVHAITNHLIEYREQKKEAKPRVSYIKAVVSKRLTSGREYSAYLRGFVTLLEEKIPLLKPLTKIKEPIAATVSTVLDISDGSVSADTVKDFFKSHRE